ncbi:hypothetical protein [Phocaeicola sp.]
MKGFIAVILFFMLALIGVRSEHFSTASDATTVVEMCAVQDDCATQKHAINEGAIVPLDRNRCVADMEFSDAHTLAHRVSASAERMFRFSSIETVLFNKALLRRMATHMSMLAHCSTRVHDTARSQNWEDACEHYIFGMRRILI